MAKIVLCAKSRRFISGMTTENVRTSNFAGWVYDLPITRRYVQGGTMDYPPAVLEKAQRLEQLLLRVASGEALDQANEALGFDLDQRRLARCQAKYETGGRTWEALIDGRHGHSRKAHSALREWLYVRKKEDDSLRAPQLVIETEEKFGVTLSAGHVN
jgi:hypothetical protein